MEFEIAYATRTELVAFSSHVVIRITDGHRSEPHDYDRLEAVIADKVGGGDYGLLVVIHHGTPPPSPETWRYATQVANRRPPGAHVIVARLGLGFWSASAQALLAKLLASLRVKDVQITGSIEEAAQVLATELIGINPDELVRGYDELYLHMRGL